MEKREKMVKKASIMGVNIAVIDMDKLIAYAEKNINDLAGKYLCVGNVHTTVMAYENEEYKKIQNDAVMVIPDGGPLVSVAHKRGYKEMKRTTGPSFMMEMLERSKINGCSHYFYGGSEDTLEKLRKVLEKKYPEAKIAGMYSPPYRELTEKEENKAIDDINKANPDFIWVGLGAPKQEKWMAKHQGIVNGFMVGVGAAFDYAAGNIKRAPEWMQKSNMEWFYRLLQDPKRLFKRYLYTNPKFIYHAWFRGE